MIDASHSLVWAQLQDQRLGTRVTRALGTGSNEQKAGHLAAEHTKSLGCCAKYTAHDVACYICRMLYTVYPHVWHTCVHLGGDVYII